MRVPHCRMASFTHAPEATREDSSALLKMVQFSTSAAPSIAAISKLRTAWMNGIQFFLE